MEEEGDREEGEEKSSVSAPCRGRVWALGPSAQRRRALLTLEMAMGAEMSLRLR